MDKVFVVQGVAQKVWASENAIDTALAETAKLLAGLTEARQQLKVGANVDAKAVAKLGEALSALTVARAAVVEAHDELAEAKLRIGVRTKLAGTYDKTQPTPPPPGGGGVTDELADVVGFRMAR